MDCVDVAIVGGGLGGVYLAYRLQKMGVNYRLFEAKPVLGGRIFSPLNQGVIEPLDLGPTWFWPHQNCMQELLDELGIESCAQHTHGDVLYQLNEDSVQRHPGADMYPSYRIVGGMARMIRALQDSLELEDVFLSSPITSIKKQEHRWQLNGSVGSSVCAKHLVLAAPPRVLMRDLPLASLLPQPLCARLSAVPTWMAGQAKFVAVYSRPFWLEQGLSGQVFSRVGPLVEIHDASFVQESVYAVFGFVGLAASSRRNYSEDQLSRLCLEQLANLWGEAALSPIFCDIKDWSDDLWVATQEDVDAVPSHPSIDLSSFRRELEDQNMYFVGAEYATQEAGYLEGALLSVQASLDFFRR